MIQNRFYTIRGSKWEARFFAKGEPFPDTDMSAPRQGVWGKPIAEDWSTPRFLGHSWKNLDFDTAVRYLPDV